MRTIATIVAASMLAVPAYAATASPSRQALRAFAGPCLAGVIDIEDPSWDPGRWNTSGSGAFGLGQARPYTKMPRAAWPRSRGGQENPWVQIRWMRGYVARWGGACGALAQDRAHHWY